VQKGDVALQILLRFLQYPPFEVYKVKCMRVLNLLCFQPLYEKREVIRNLFPVKNSIDHMATEQSHLDLVSSMWVYFCILVYRFEYI